MVNGVVPLRVPLIETLAPLGIERTLRKANLGNGFGADGVDKGAVGFVPVFLGISGGFVSAFIISVRGGIGGRAIVASAGLTGAGFAGAGFDGTGAGFNATGAGFDGTGAGFDGSGAAFNATGAGLTGTGAGLTVGSVSGAGKVFTGAGTGLSGAGCVLTGGGESLTRPDPFSCFSGSDSLCWY